MFFIESACSGLPLALFILCY